MDYTSGILDEIALEGLDGITIEALWTRLHRRPDFILPPNDEHSKRYLWNIIRRLRNIDFFELPEPRPKLIIYNRYDNIDPEIGIVMEPDPLPLDIYPYFIINDTEYGIMGSCSSYYIRNRVLVRKLSLPEVVDTFGDRLVIVASQEVRFRALVGLQSNPTLEITPSQYGLLERIGRARYHGEVTQGKMSLQQIGADAKSIFYFRKFLLQHGLITKQVFHLRSHNQSLTGLLLHLTRFYSLVRMKYAAISENIIKFLKEQPNYIAEYSVVKEVLGVNDLKRIVKLPEFQKLVKTDGKLPYKTLYPDSESKKHPGKKPDKEKLVRILQLIDPDIDVGDVQKKFEGNEDEEDDEDEKNRGIIDDKNRLMDVSMMTQFYMILRTAGSLGLSQSEVARQLGLNKLQSRTMCRNMLKTGSIGMYMIDIGRQRVTRYFLKNISDTGLPVNLPEQRIVDTYQEEIIPEQEDMESIQDAQEEESLKRSMEEYEEYVAKRPKFEERRKSEDEYNRVPKLDEFLNLSGGQFEVDRGEEFLKRQHTEQMEYSYECSDQMIMVLDEEMSSVYLDTQEEDEKKNFEILNDPSVKIEVTDKLSWTLISERSKQKEKKELTQRVIKRVEMVLDSVQRHKILDLTKLMSFMNEEELKQGEIGRMDKKSLLRILQRLSDSGSLKVFTVLLRHDTGSERKVLYVTDSGVTINDILTSSYVENAKFKFLSKLRNRTQEPVKKLKKVKVSDTTYGHNPKFNRMRSLHRVLFYLVYGYEGLDVDQSKALEEIQKESKSITDINDLPTLYTYKLNWKMFVPPLPDYHESKGWILIFDLLMRLPLSIFMQVIRIPQHIPELSAYLKHPVKRYLPLRYLPKDIQDNLTFRRRYIFTAYDVIARLAYIGLVQIGPQQNKDKDQTFIFVNRNSMLFDTTSSKPGYHKITKDVDYPLRRYSLDCMAKVDEYWHDMWKICMHTRLGERTSMVGSEVVLENLADKKDMIEALRMKEFQEAPVRDIGVLPGDNSGAAGLDSMLFAHLKRNWSNKRGVKRVATTKREEPKVTKHKNITKKVTITHIQRGRAKKSRTIIRKVAPRKTMSPRRPYYDQIDREALLKMSKLRVDWSKKEDHLLILCKVASLFLCPGKRKVNKNLFVKIREVLHDTYQCSRNKTSRACTRRITFMLRNPNTCYNISLLVEELRQDTSIMSKYEPFIEKLKTGLDLTQEFNETFEKLVQELIERYSKSSLVTVESDLDIPDTLQEFEQNYEVIVPESKLNPKDMYSKIENLDDIQSAVMKVTIQSTLSTNLNNSTWAYNLFSIYQQYPEKLLRKSLNELRKSTVLSLKKNCLKSQLSGSYLPLTASPYQLSIGYINLLQTKYQSDLYDFCRKMYEKLPSNEKIEVISLQGGTTSALVQLLSCNAVKFEIEVPNQMIVLDPNVKNKDETYSRLVQRYQDMLTKYKTDLLTTTALFTKDFCLDDKRVEEETESNVNYQNAVAKAASRIALYLVNDDTEMIEPKEMQHAHDFFVVNSCRVFVKSNNLMEMPSDEFFEDIYSGIQSSMLFPDMKDIVTDLTNIITEENQDLASRIIEELKNSNELGVTNRRIREMFGNNVKITSILRDLMESHVVLRTGVVDTRYVHHSHVKPWIVSSYESDENEPEPSTSQEPNENPLEPKIEIKTIEALRQSKQIYVVMKPWIQINGKINHKVLDSHLRSVLSHIMIHSGVSLEKIQERFSPAIQPQHTFELCEILTKLTCVHARYIQEMGIVNLFSKPSSVKEFEPTGLEDAKEIIYEADKCGIIKLGMFVGKFSNNEDFFQFLLGR